MKKNKDLRVYIGDVIFELEEAVGKFGLSKRQIELRATDELTVDNITYKWVNLKTRRSYLGKRSRRKGNAWECEIIQSLKDNGYDGVVSARSESKRTDDAKVDIIDLKDELPCYIQAKNTTRQPSWETIEKQCPLKDKPFVIAWKGSKKLAILPLDFFYSLINNVKCKMPMEKEKDDRIT